jgi:hypothetical protein
VCVIVTMRLADMPLRVRGRLHMIVMLTRLRLEKLFWIFFELCKTVLAAKKISLPVIDVASGGVRRLHFHATDRVDHILILS